MTVTELRRVTLGGSSAAAACGVDPYLSPVMLWAQLTGKAERPETEAMTWGKRLEPLIYAALEGDGYELLPAPADGFRDPERKWLLGHPDGFTRSDGARWATRAPGATGTPPDEGSSLSPGLVAVLEIKTANQWAHRAGWSEDAPVQYQAQAQVYMHLTGRARTLLACLVAGSRLEVRTIERDEDAIGLLLDGMERFLRYVRRDRPPPPDGSDSTREALVHRLYPEAEPSKLVRLDREHWNLVRELRGIDEGIAIRKRQRQAIINRLTAFAGDAELAISPHDTPAFRWGNRRDRRVDVTRLREELPEVAAEYEKTTTTRRFQLL